MARDIKLNFRNKRPKLELLLDEFDKGVMTLIDESDLPKQAARQAKNLMQVEDGTWAPRWGSDWYGTDLGAEIDGGDTFFKSSDSTNHLVVVAGGTVYRSTDNGTTWDTCSGGSFTAGNFVKMKQIKDKLWMVNGVDAILRYDGSTTLEAFTGLSAPTGLTATESGLTGTSHTYYYAVAATNEVGSTLTSSEASEQVSKDRDTWAASGETIALSWTAVAGATRYDIYIGTESGFLFYLTSTENNSYTDDGSVAINTFLETPNDDTTTGPVAGDIELSGNRLWLTKSTDDKYRVYWGGTGAYQGRFSSFYGGGWVDLEQGGRETPQSVAHFQDGKGNSNLTVLTKDPEGNGSIWQIALETATVGETSFTIPATTKLVGSVGTTSYRSVVKVGNNIFFANSKGVFTLGPKPQLLNLLDTDEISANIRPTWQDVKLSALDKIAGYYYDAKLFLSVPYGSDINNRIMVFDTERRNWSPEAFDFGVESFFEYTDTDSINSLLCWKDGGTRLIKISKSLKGDFGGDFTTKYISPLIPLTKTRTGFAKIKKAFIEIARPQGAIQFEVTGQGPKGASATVGSETIDSGQSVSGWSSSGWSSTSWSDTDGAPDTFAQASLIRFIKINETLANIQFTVTTTSRNDYYILRALSAEGFVIPKAQPSVRKL